jgi:hypothetical protein
LLSGVSPWYQSGINLIPAAAMEKALTLRLPPDLYDRAAAQADAMGLSFSAYARLALSEFSRWKARDLAAVRRPVSAAAPAPAVSKPVAQSLNAPCACGSGLKYKRCCGAR